MSDKPARLANYLLLPLTEYEREILDVGMAELAAARQFSIAQQEVIVAARRETDTLVADLRETLEDALEAPTVAAMTASVADALTRLAAVSVGEGTA